MVSRLVCFALELLSAYRTNHVAGAWGIQQMHLLEQ